MVKGKGVKVIHGQTVYFSPIVVQTCPKNEFMSLQKNLLLSMRLFKHIYYKEPSVYL